MCSLHFNSVMEIQFNDVISKYKLADLTLKSHTWDPTGSPHSGNRKTE